MNTDEMKLITDLAEQLKSMDNAKDPDANAAIQQHITLVPEAVYKLVQLVLIQHMAIDQLKAKISAIETKPVQTQTPPKGFLDDLKDKLFGGTSTTTQPAVNLNNTQRPAETLSSNPAINSSSSFLKQAMTVGAGVAGGMMLGNAIGSLFQHNNGSTYTQPTETIENNYYGQDQNNDSAAAQNTSYDDDTQDDANDQDDSSSFDDNSSDGGDWT